MRHSATTNWKRSLGCVFAALILAVPGCADDPPMDPDFLDPLEMAVTPSQVTVQVEGTATLTAEVSDADEIQDLQITWTSGDAAIVTVRSTGERTAEVTGESPGTTSVTATLSGSNIESQSASAGVEVTGE